mmetsp:Transcript_27864/g.40741  ORF Transcript_27864/g.40741 Transcript_27864/m.40741 type:complete len:117 (+) Transcript_27864:122-472(+)
MLSTVEINASSNANSGRLCNSLCFLLRKMNYPVVNDRFCKREYASLPRYVRNVLKNKLCIGCYGVTIKRIFVNHDKGGKMPRADTNEMTSVQVDSPERLYVSHWVGQDCCEKDSSR